MSIHVISCRRGLHEKLLVDRLVMKFSAVDKNIICFRMPAFVELKKKMGDVKFMANLTVRWTLP